MVDILKSNLDYKYINFWFDVGIKVKINIKGDVNVYFDATFLIVIIKIYIKKFNYGINFTFNYNLLEDKEIIIQKILQSIKFKVYKEVFEMEGE